MRNFGFYLGLILAMGLTSAQDPSCVKTLIEEVLQCLLREKLNLTIHPDPQNPTAFIENVFELNSNYMCQNTARYKSAMECTINTLKNCLQPLGMGSALIDFNKYSQGVDFFCSKLDRFDTGCFEKENGNIKQCEKEIHQKLSENSPSSVGTEGICLNIEVKYNCSREELSKCSLETKEIYMEHVDQFGVPTACLSNWPKRTYKSRLQSKSAGNNNPPIYSFVLFLGVVSYLLLV